MTLTPLVSIPVILTQIAFEAGEGSFPEKAEIIGLIGVNCRSKASKLYPSLAPAVLWSPVPRKVEAVDPQR